jgi:HEAT repeat protein
MSRRVRIALAVLVLAAAGGIGWLVLCQGEPKYHGKPLHVWLADFDLSRSQRPEKATEAVRAIGTNALPLLDRMIRTKDSLWRTAMIALNDRQSFIQLEITEARVIRYRAIEGYRVLGPNAKASIPVLIHILDSEPSVEVRADVAAALGSIGPEASAAIPALLKTAQTQNADLRRNAIIAVADIQRSTPGPSEIHTRW